MKVLSLKAKLFVYATGIAGLWSMYVGLTHWEGNLGRFLCYLAIAIVASRLKVSLPGVTGTMSVNFVFILLGVLELSFSETLVIGTAAGLTQCFWLAKKRPSVNQLIFNAG